MTQSIEVKDFTGGRNFVTSPFNLYPTEGTVFTNISLDETGMRTSNFVADIQLLSARLDGPIQIAPKLGEKFDLTHSNASFTEKVRFYQGNRYIIVGGEAMLLGAGGAKHSTVVAQSLDASVPQEPYVTPENVMVEPEPEAGPEVKIEAKDRYHVESHTYYISYRSEAGFESPLEELGVVNAMLSWDENYTTETISKQDVIVVAPPAQGDYGRIYRMGDNISYPTLVFQFDHNWTVSLSGGIVNSNAGTFMFQIKDHQLGFRATTWGAVYPSDLRYLTATKYGLAASKGSQIYLSINKPDAWSELSSLELGSEITGIASVYRGFIIFTEGAYCYLVTGSSADNLQINLLSTDIGCTSNSTIAEVGQHALVWIYNRRFYMFNGSSIRELEPNTYDFDYFVRNGFNKDLTGVSMYDKYFIGTDKGITAVSLVHRYKPFIDFELPAEFTVGTPGYLRETLVDAQKFLGAYKEDGSFWALKPSTYEDINYEDPAPATDGWAMGCYSTAEDGSFPSNCEEDLTSCINFGCYGGFKGCEDTAPNDCLSWYEDGCIVITPGESQCVMPTMCKEGALVGLYPDWYEGNPDEPGVIPVLHKSEYYSPMFTFGAINDQCTFSSVEVLFRGELSILAYIDNKEIVFRDNYLSEGPQTARLIMPNAEARGNYLQVRLRFNGMVYGYSVNGEPLRQMSK